MGKNTEGCVATFRPVVLMRRYKMRMISPMEAVETILRKSHHGEFDQSGCEKQMSTSTEVIHEISFCNRSERDSHCL